MKKTSNKFTQPGFFKRLTCFFLGHKFLYAGDLKSKELPTLQNYIYDETETHLKTVGLTFCPRCYGFSGIHFLQEKVVQPEPIIEKKKDLKSLKGSKGFTNKKKKK